VLQSPSLFKPGTERLADLWYALTLNHLACLKSNERLSFCPINGLVFERVEPANKKCAIEVGAPKGGPEWSPPRCLHSFWSHVCEKTSMTSRTHDLALNPNLQADPPMLIRSFPDHSETSAAASQLLTNTDWQVWLTRPSTHRSYHLQTPLLDLPLDLVFAAGGRELQAPAQTYSPIKQLLRSLLKSDFGNECQTIMSVGLQAEGGLVWLRQSLDQTHISAKSLSQEIDSLRRSTEYFMKQLSETCSAVH
jgi:hypothetical protein